MWLRFSRGHLYLWRRRLCAVDRLKDYGRLQVDREKRLHEMAALCGAEKTHNAEDGDRQTKPRKDSCSSVRSWTDGGGMFVTSHVSFNVVRGIPAHRDTESHVSKKAEAYSRKSYREGSH